VIDGRLIKRAIRRLRSIKFNQNLIVFSFFLLVSAVFWFFNALNREYYTDLTIPVKYVNLPENKLPVGSTKDYVKVNISAYGYQVMDYKASTINPVIIDMKQTMLQSLSRDKNKRFFILTSTIRDDISKILGPNFRINSISPDTLYIDLLRVLTKKLPVKRNFSLEFRKQFALSDSIEFNPDTVIIKGPESILDTVHAIYTQETSFRDLHDSSWFEIPLQEIRGTQLSHNMVNCRIAVEEFTELEFKLPVFILNEPIGYSVKLFPSEIRLLFNVGFSKYKNITPDQFKLTVDYFELEKAGNSRVIIKIDQKPEHISSIRLIPQSVDFIIEKND
jgi:hypothetical protein